MPGTLVLVIKETRRVLSGAATCLIIGDKVAVKFIFQGKSIYMYWLPLICMFCTLNECENSL